MAKPPLGSERQRARNTHKLPGERVQRTREQGEPKLVELLTRYSNPAWRSDLQACLQAVSKDDPADDEPELGGGQHPGKRAWGMRDRLGEATIHEIADVYREGKITIAELAEKFAVSQSSIKRILRTHNVRRRRAGPPT